MHLVFAVPDPAETGGGGTDYMNGLIQALRLLGHDVDVAMSAEPSFPAGVTPIIDGMLLPKLRHRLAELVHADVVTVVHHVSAAAGRDPAARQQVHGIEAEMLPHIRRVVATSAPVAARLGSEFGISAAVVTQGAQELPRATPDSADPIILAVGVLKQLVQPASYVQTSSALARYLVSSLQPFFQKFNRPAFEPIMK